MQCLSDLAGGDLAQGLLEHRAGLAARNQVAIVDDDGRDGVYAGRMVAGLAVSDLLGKVLTLQHGGRLRPVQASRLGRCQQDFVLVHGLAVAVTGLQKCEFELALLGRIDLAGPMQESVRIEGVVDPRSAVHVEFEAHLGTAPPDVVARLCLLLRRGAVLLGQVLAHVLAARTHVWVEFEGQKVHGGADVRLQSCERLLQRAQTHRAPGAGDVRDEVDFQIHDGVRGLSSVHGIASGPDWLQPRWTIVVFGADQGAGARLH